MPTDRPRPASAPLLPTALLLAPLALAACGGGTDDPAPTQPDPTDDGWTLVWSDEFNGSSLDDTKWTPQIGDGCDISPDLCGWGNNELQWYQAENATVANGLLTIEARVEAGGRGRNFTSARLRTINKGDWRYGRFEARARLPEGQGMWPAIWMLPTVNRYGEWAASGEIDIMELVGHQPGRVHGTIHYGGTFPGNRSTGDYIDLPRGSFADEFHTFAVEWEEGEIRWYMDGQLYQTLTSWNSTGGPFPAPFDQEFHLILNVAVGGNWPGPPDATTVFPQVMEVDWVRVYTRS
jgi:beta-glucanase (GH16 family)